MNFFKKSLTFFLCLIQILKKVHATEVDEDEMEKESDENEDPLIIKIFNLSSKIFFLL